MKFLLVDTASFSPSFCFAEDDKPEHVVSLESSGRGTEELSASFCVTADKYPEFLSEKLSGVAVVAGPGPFIALRTGTMFAQGLAFSLGIPIVGLCTLKAFVPSQEGDFAVIMESGMHGAFVLFGTHKKKETIFEKSPFFCCKTKLMSVMEEKNINNIVSVGGKRLKEWIGDSYFLEIGKPHLHMWVKEAHKLLKNEDRGFLIEPFYLKKSL